MLKRVWTRSGGDTAMFERLIPDDDASAQIPPSTSAKNDGLTISAIQPSVKGLTVKGESAERAKARDEAPTRMVEAAVGETEGAEVGGVYSHPTQVDEASV